MTKRSDDGMDGVKRWEQEPFELERFVEAQEGTYAHALTELRQGRKETHWMWFIFPQAAGLGSSPMAMRYAIGSMEEARAYLRHPVLGPRLLDCCRALLALEGQSASEVMGYPDDLKLRSSMTLFALLSEGGPVFRAVLDKYFDGENDGRTVEWAERFGKG